ncbi:hypothetical protein HPB52_017588 [Rhipicephalus sanguineus]|uniref:Uncharacterized protein n=1 Tax=Rhipicephalus sanguineus TaxID=34632 RepID=A0A9D4Q1C6_RHISA|nr:hypothetical protein HPB52_017588 [Rhipicephalus sanguineus]
MDGAPIILAPTTTDVTRQENHKQAEITTKTTPTSQQQHQEYDQSQKEIKKEDQHGLTSIGGGNHPGGISASPNPGYASFVDESDMVVLRLLELLHSVLLFGMKLLKSHGRYAYSAS